jgi:hypothetical protein
MVWGCGNGDEGGGWVSQLLLHSILISRGSAGLSELEDDGPTSALTSYFYHRHGNHPCHNHRFSLPFPNLDHIPCGKLSAEVIQSDVLNGPTVGFLHEYLQNLYLAVITIAGVLFRSRSGTQRQVCELEGSQPRRSFSDSHPQRIWIPRQWKSMSGELLGCQALVSILTLASLWSGLLPAISCLGMHRVLAQASKLHEYERPVEKSRAWSGGGNCIGIRP